jgi:hypothetical protein
MRIPRRDIVSAAIGAGAGVAGIGAVGYALNRPLPAWISPAVNVRVDGQSRIVESNGLPDHPTGDFPNRHDPFAVRPRRHRLRMPLNPVRSERPIPLAMWWFGVAINGVPFDPSGPYWSGESSSGWQFEVMHPANSIALGIDRNNAHTQGDGMYHYHGLPTGLLSPRPGAGAVRAMKLVGYAADGYPVYGPECPAAADDLESPVRRLRSSYRLSESSRQGGPRGKPDGRFVEDYVFDPDHGDLDECNGRFGLTPDYPDGTYHYVLTDAFPCIPRFFHGLPDESFRHGPPPGVSAPLPPELRRYRGTDA